MQHRRPRSTVLVTAFMLAAAGGVSALPAAASATAYTGHAAAPTDPLTLWYDRPATDWESQALPIGNGALGAMIFGGIGQEHVQFNEKTLWTGGPGNDPSYTGGIWTAPRPGALAEARRLVLQQGPQDPQVITDLLAQPREGYGSYQTFGDLYLDGETPAEVSGYRRELDLRHGVARVRYTVGSTTFTREAFASYPDHTIVLRISADRRGSVSFATRLATPHPQTAVSVAGGRLTLAGHLSNGMALESQVLVRNDGGSRVDGTDRVTVTGADSVTLLLAAGTSYVHRYPDYTGADPHRRVTATLDAAARRSFRQLLARQQTDYRGLFDRVRLDLGQRTPQLPTDRLLAAYTGGSTSDDRALEALFFAYGRYLLISSSRAGSLPANLQGVWNKDTSAAWSADYHVNINLQMNYWPAEVTNLTETTSPLFDYIDGLRPRGRAAARAMFDSAGWVVQNETTPFDYTGVHDWPTAFWLPEAAAWLTQHMWEHYQFTRDTGFLRRTGYPVMREAAEFWLANLVRDPRDGTLVAAPSYSPEHGPYTAGAAMSQQIVWDLFTNVLTASRTIGADPAFRARVQRALAQLDPGLRVGRWGQLQEWKEDLDDPQDTHRHVSHLFSLYPGDQIGPSTTPALAQAAQVSLQARESDPAGWSPGWSRAWKINFWARLLHGNEAFVSFRDQLRSSTLPNLFDTHPPFQIDGNFGATAGVAEMLVQSQTEAIRILPALPSAWPTGSVDGLRARGAVTVGVDWRDGRATRVRLRSDHGGLLRLQSTLVGAGVRLVDTATGRSVRWTRDGADTIRFNARAGGSYQLSR
jgi:alpha-L-fucosidase 2